MSDNTQLTSASGYDVKRMIFSEAQTGTIPNSVPPINYRRINIQTRNEDGTIGDLIFPTTKLFSFGVSENTSPDTGKVNGYVMPLCLWNRDGHTKEEKEWSDTFDSVIERVKKHLIETREEIEQYDLAMSDLKKFNPLYWKKDKGKIIEGTGPTLYAKLIVSKKQEKIITMFYDQNENQVDPYSLLGKYCYAEAAVKIESVFVGNKLSMQIKLYECKVKLMETGMKSLLKRPSAEPRSLDKSDTSIDFKGEISDHDSTHEFDGEKTPKKATVSVTPPSAPKKKIPRRVINKKAEASAE